MNIPSDRPLSKDIIDRREGQKPSIGEKVRNVALKVKTDWNDMKEAERKRKGEPVKKSDAPYSIPSYKRGGTVKKTGLAYVHKGEKVISKSKVAKYMKRGK